MSVSEVDLEMGGRGPPVEKSIVENLDEMLTEVCIVIAKPSTFSMQACNFRHMHGIKMQKV